QFYKKALALDPQYAEVYVSLGFTYYLEWAWHWSTDPQTLTQVFVLAQKALALDDSGSAAHFLLGAGYALAEQYDQAIAEEERAISLNPNNADSYGMQSEVFNFAGRPEEALKSIAQAMRLNPHYPPSYLINLGWADLFAGRYAEAITTLREAISR